MRKHSNYNFSFDDPGVITGVTMIAIGGLLGIIGLIKRASSNKRYQKESMEIIIQCKKLIERYPDTEVSDYCNWIISILTKPGTVQVEKDDGSIIYLTEDTKILFAKEVLSGLVGAKICRNSLYFVNSPYKLDISRLDDAKVLKYLEKNYKKIEDLQPVSVVNDSDYTILNNSLDMRETKLFKMFLDTHMELLEKYYNTTRENIVVEVIAVNDLENRFLVYTATTEIVTNNFSELTKKLKRYMWF